MTEPLSALVDQLVGPHIGLIEALLAVEPEPDDVGLAVYAGRLCCTSALGPIDAATAVSGAAIEQPQALSACLGEALERYAAALPGPDRIRRGTIDSLPQRAIAPDRFALFSAAQHRQPGFPFVRWTATDELGWTQAWSLTRQEPVWVPAAFVWQPYVPSRSEPPLTPCLTTGLACGPTWNEAVTAGLCEVVERDALALAWLGCIQPRRIRHEGAPVNADVQTMIERLRRGGFRFGLFDLTTDLGLPVIAAVIEGHSPLGWIVSFGSAAACDPDRALLKALVEAAHCRMYVKSLLREQPLWRAGKRLEHVTSFADHARFYTVHAERRAAIDHWWNTPHEVEWTQLSAGRPDFPGYEVLAVDITTPDVQDLGQCVARVVVPGLQPLHGHHAWPHLGGQRLLELKQIFGSHVCQPRNFNPWPHPFA